jgi:hypothetical protein
MWQLPEDTIVDDPMKVKRTVTGKDVSNMLDTQEERDVDCMYSNRSLEFFRIHI